MIGLLFLLVTSVGATPPKPVVTSADHAAMRAACVRYGKTGADAAAKAAMTARCIAQIPRIGSPLVTRPVVPVVAR